MTTNQIAKAPRPPTFLGIGSQNCGTTWATACLAQHPDIFIPDRKEISYFDVDYYRGWDWYLSYFAIPENYSAWGEWSPGYICRDQAFERVTKQLENIRVIALFRNPVDRLFSHYWRFRAEGATHKPLLQAIDSNKEFIRMSLYADDWGKWLRHYGNDNCHAMIFEDLLRNPLAEYKKLFSFLGVDAAFEPDLEAAKQRQNAIQLNRRQWLMDGVAYCRTSLQKLGLSPLVGFAKRVGVRKLLISMAQPSSNGYRGKSLTLSERQMLYEKYFENDVTKLEMLLGNRDLSIWSPTETP